MIHRSPIRHFAQSIALVLLAALAGCNTTKGIGHINPEYDGHRLSNVAVYVDNLGEVGDALEASIVEQLKSRGVQARSVRTFARFSKSQDEFTRKVWALGVQDAVVIAMSDSRGTVLAGYQSWGQASTIGNTTNVSVTTTPMASVSRTMLTTSRIYNSKGDKVWEATTERSAQGLAFTTDGLTVSETTKALMQSLEKDGLVAAR
jgi:hypothetical protein